MLSKYQSVYAVEGNDAYRENNTKLIYCVGKARCSFLLLK
jgi:hypothetical protein